MGTNKITIAIVEDDINLANTLKEGIEQKGFKVLVFNQPEKALNACRIQDIHAYVIDCLLPKMSGVDLALKIREQESEPSQIIFMSGIYKDKAFIKDTLQKTKSEHFLSKPFDIKDLTTILEDKLTLEDNEPQEPLYELLKNSMPTPDERLEALYKTKSIHGYDLPLVISRLLHTGICGILKLNSNNTDESSIYFSLGKITQVRLQDPKSFFGALLVSNNFISPDDLEKGLSIPTNKRVGEALVEANLISPHAIDIINAEQMGIRLSCLIKDQMYDISFEVTSPSASESKADLNRISTFYSDWILSKIPLSHLQSMYLPWEDCPIILMDKFEESYFLKTLPPFNLINDLEAKLKQRPTLSQLLEHLPNKEMDLLGAIHLLTLTEVIYFDPSLKTSDINAKILRLNKIFKDMENQNHFEVLGLTKKAKSTEIKKSYLQLAKLFHPDKIPTSAPDELKVLNDKVFSRMVKAHEVLIDESTKKNYLKELEQGQAENILKSEALFEDGRRELQKGQAQKALTFFEESISLRPPPAELTLHWLWARLLNLSKSKDIKSELTEVQVGLNKIPPEERHSSIYYFVKGLFQKHIGEMELAKRNMEHALALTPNFVEAKRELNVITLSNKNKSIDLLNADLKDVVGHLFKKSKTG